MKCCSGLVCSPVLNETTSLLEARCTVPDKSQFDSNECYDVDETCFFNYQCCTSHCRDDDGDGAYTCEDPWATDAPNWWWVDSSKEESAHWGTASGSAPVLAILIIIGLVVAVLAVVVPGILHRRRLRELGVDKLPEETLDDGWAMNNFGGKFLVNWAYELGASQSVEPEQEAYQPLIDDDQTEDVMTEGPPLPLRDYDGHTFGPIDIDAPPQPERDY